MSVSKSLSIALLSGLLAGSATINGVVAGEDTASASASPAMADPAVVYQPSVTPDRIVLTWSGDPATTQSVTWRTSTDVTSPVAEITVADADPAFAETGKLFTATSQSLTSDLGTAAFHTVKFTGLEPSTRYAYRVGDGVNWTEWFHFSTASDQPEPFSFIYFGDAQNNVRSMWSRVIREAQRDQPKAAFFLHAGDLINRAEADAEWGEWFEAGDFLNAMIPSVAIPGNHEQAKLPDGSRRLSHHWRPTFDFPTNGPEGLEESCYTMVYQGVRIIGLNSNTEHEIQAQWMDQVLADNECRWVICTMHHPIYSTGKDRDNAELRNLWKPIFDKYHVDLVLQGHDHTYGRTGLETPLVGSNVPSGTSGADAMTGTVYVVSVSGPKMYPVQRHNFMMRQAGNTQLYQIIHIDGDKLRYEARTAVGELYDAFTLVKQDGDINAIHEQVPDTPERVKITEPVAATAAGQ